MRFISKAQAFKTKAIPAKQTLINTPRGPEQITESESYIALFEQGGATARDKALALERFQFKGSYEKEDVTRRISIFDTDERARREGWDPEKKAAIEAALIEGQDEFYFLVEDAPAERPWDNYDDTPADSVAATAELIGKPFDEVARYERQNQNRPDVLKALEGDEVADEVEVEA